MSARGPQGAAPGQAAHLATSRRDLVIPAVVVGVLALMVVPLPTLALDLLLACSITMSLLVLLTSIHIVRPVEFSAFPSVLLVLTLFRLALNVASTRLILLNGAEGGGAGAIIQAFGSFVVGGNSVVGIVIFLILVLINFAVITKGSGRIAEVAARFTLDALPGKQMSIDADLAAGLIDQNQARQRRTDVSREADFYGAMDGASKFVRGDAVAGLIITGINIVGGLVVGLAQKGMGFVEAGETYTVLTVGDGLVSQIPALLISTASGVIITRAAGASRLGDEVSGQLGRQPAVLWMTAVMIGLVSMVPGIPVAAFVPAAVILAVLARRAKARAQGAASTAAEEAAGESSREEKITDLLPVELLQLEVGYQLVHLVDVAKGGQLLERIASIRKMMARELGIVVPLIHVRDNLDLAPNEYRLLLREVPVGGGQIEVNRLLALDQGGITEKLPGNETKDPAFGVDAVWIDTMHRVRAERAGYVVAEPTTVVATHLTELLRTNASDLLGRQELQELLDVVSERNPKVVEELIPKLLTAGEVIQVLRRLLEESVSIRDLRTILETMADHAATHRDVYRLTELVRRRLANQITAGLVSEDGVLYAALPDRAMEEALRGSLVEAEGRLQLAMDLPTAEALMGQVSSVVDRFTVEDRPVVVVVPTELRAPLGELVRRIHPDLSVLAQAELSPRVQLRAIATLSGEGLSPRARRPGATLDARGAGPAPGTAGA